MGHFVRGHRRDSDASTWEAVAEGPALWAGLLRRREPKVVLCSGSYETRGRLRPGQQEGAPRDAGCQLYPVPGVARASRGSLELISVDSKSLFSLPQR